MTDITYTLSYEEKVLHTLNHLKAKKKRSAHGKHITSVGKGWLELTNSITDTGRDDIKRNSQEGNHKQQNFV